MLMFIVFVLLFLTRSDTTVNAFYIGCLHFMGLVSSSLTSVRLQFHLTEAYNLEHRSLGKSSLLGSGLSRLLHWLEQKHRGQKHEVQC
jgi:hypothetical protein